MNKYEYRMSNAALGQSFALSDIARQMGRMSDSVSYGAEKIAESNLRSAEQIAESNKFIAASISASAFFLYSAVTSISTEMKKKRETDEYYLLTDRIDSLHEKIIQNGGNLLEIYQKMTSSVRAQVCLSDVDLRLICALFQYQREGDLEWLINQSKFYEQSPSEIIKEMFKKGEWRAYIDRHSGKMILSLTIPSKDNWLHWDYNIELNRSFNKEIDFGHAVDNVWNYKGKQVSAKIYDDIPKDLRYNIFFDEEMRLELFEEERKYFLTEFQDGFPAGNQQISMVTKINNFVDEMNWQIVLNNLRTLYSELRDAYTKLLVNNSQKK